MSVCTKPAMLSRGLGFSKSCTISKVRMLSSLLAQVTIEVPAGQVTLPGSIAEP